MYLATTIVPYALLPASMIKNDDLLAEFKDQRWILLPGNFILFAQV
jgi:hypothetical protein